MRNQTAHIPELLAPAGGRAQLEAAVRFGADAVYFACDRFGLRQRASNFALDDVPAAVACAHAAGAKAYVAVNALMDADDVAALPAYLEALDAAVAARMWHELGASRVVCAREMSVEDIARMRADAPRDLELEAFVHGAMCMAVSGRCLLSSAMAGRSGNRGHCAQPCRWSYALVEEQRPGEFYPVEEDVRGTYVMNAQDLCMVEHLDDLAAAGVDSLKIEGRNKKAFYVASVVHAYRRVLDGADPAEGAAELACVSHRPYSTGFYYGAAEQSPECDGYVRECLHAADVRVCAPAGHGAWRVEAVCRNRFCEGDELEAVVPGRASFSVRVRNLAWLPRPDADDPHPAPVPAAVANRSAEAYAFTVAEELSPGDFLRIRTP